MGTAGLVVFPLLVAVSTFGTANGTLFIGTRVTYVSAREGHLPDFLSGLHVTAKTPVPAIVVLVRKWEIFVSPIYSSIGIFCTSNSSIGN